MSWFTSISNVTAANAEATISAAEANIGDFGHDEMVEQVEAAKGAAIALVLGGSLGRSDDDEYEVRLNGHANPGHALTPGWAEDSITITIKRAT